MRHVSLSRESDSFLTIEPVSFLIHLLVLSITLHGRAGYEPISPLLILPCCFSSPQKGLNLHLLW